MGMYYWLSSTWMSILTAFKYAGNVDVQPAQVPKAPPSPKPIFFKSRENTGKVGMSFSFGTLATADHYQTVDITITNKAERLIQALSKYALGATTHPSILLSFGEE
jgi:hypothetical protein